MVIRPYQSKDLDEWLRMRVALWPELAEGKTDPRADAEQWLGRPNATVIVAEHPASEGLVGFVEIGEREYADGCDTSPVAYLEGWYVSPDVRHLGIGATLLRAAET
jgi:aminoglycoside 6'-N-acetyltransferase I